MPDMHCLSSWKNLRASYHPSHKPHTPWKKRLVEYSNISVSGHLYQGSYLTSLRRLAERPELSWWVYSLVAIVKRFSLWKLSLPISGYCRYPRRRGRKDKGWRFETDVQFSSRIFLTHYSVSCKYNAEFREAVISPIDRLPARQMIVAWSGEEVFPTLEQYWIMNRNFPRGQGR